MANTHVNPIHDFTDVNAKQMCRNLEGSRQLALRFTENMGVVVGGRVSFISTLSKTTVQTVLF